MPIHDYNIANQTFPATRSDINNALEAIVTKNSSGTAPPDTYAYMWWYDTATTTLKIRNRDDDAWISFASFDQDNDTVNFLDSEVSIAGVTTSATGTVLTLTDSTVTSSVDFIIDNQKEIRFKEQTGNGTNYVALKAPASLTLDTTFILPSADGTANQILKTDGSGNLSFVDSFTDISWQSVKTADFTAVAREAYPVDTTLTAITVTLPATPSAGDQVQLVDYAGTFDTKQLVIDPNGEDIEGGTDNLVLRGKREGVILTYIDSTQGWIATSGINEGTDALEPNAYEVDFLVVAGGGAGGNNFNFSIAGGGGGGAGGYRNSFSTETSGGGGSSEASLTFDAGTVYTITVGAGAPTNSTNNAQGGTGNNSSISGTGITTITSSGGGGGGGSGTTAGASGGSGGGSVTPSSAGTGTANQGFSGGIGNEGGGGGGGASAVGVAGGASNGGNGGAGLASSITGSSISRAGGGGGAGRSNPSGTKGTGGTGGGGNGAQETPSTSATAGTINTGSGGGGGSATDAIATGAAGGKGVVILRMPTARYSGTTTGSPTVGTDGTDTILTFNDSGSYTG